MIRKILLSVSLLFIFLVSVANAAVSKNVVMVTQQKPTFNITMDANVTTGFSWYLLNYNANLIKPLKHVYEEDGSAAKKGWVGAPGKSVWTFKVLPAAFNVPTLTHLSWVYIRPWEGITDNDTRAQYTIVISDQK